MTAVAATLLLHLVLAGWLLTLKWSTPSPAVEIASLDWVPPAQPIPPPPAVQPLPMPSETVQVPSPFLAVPEAISPPLMEYDWYGDARAVAGALGGPTERQTFGSAAKPERKLKSKPEGPPPFFEQPLPRVGTTVRTPEGETILWVSDYCFISLSSQSLTMKDFHDARQGVRQCIIPIGKAEPRGDLFDHLKRPSHKQQ